MAKAHSNLPADIRLQLYGEAMQLRSERPWGYRRIANALSAQHGIHVPKGTVSNWILGTHNPIRRLHRYFRSIPSPELSYVIGAVLGDGYVTEDRGRGIVGFTNKDRYLLEHFRFCLSTILNTERAGRITRGTTYGVFKTTVGSRMLALFLQRPLEEIVPFIEEHPAPFIRGFFDSEGHVGVTASRGRLSVTLGASNTDIEILDYISGLLRRRFGIISRINLTRRSSPILIRGRVVPFPRALYCLHISRFADVQTFMSKIGFKSTRKQGLLGDAIHVLRTHGSRGAVAFWDRSYVRIESRWCKRMQAHVVDGGGPGET